MATAWENKYLKEVSTLRGINALKDLNNIAELDMSKYWDIDKWISDIYRFPDGSYITLADIIEALL
jgi:hypothetical protein